MFSLFRSYKKALIYPVAALALVISVACAGTVSVQPTTPSPAPVMTPTSPLPPAAAPAEATKVAVTLMDGKVTLDMTMIPAGEVRFMVKNDGTINHGFAVMGNEVDQTTGFLTPGETTTLDATLTSGEYEGYCPVPGHRGKGMTTMFTVK